MGISAVNFQCIIVMLFMYLHKSVNQKKLVFKVHQSAGLHHRFPSFFRFRHSDILVIDGIQDDFRFFLYLFCKEFLRSHRLEHIARCRGI